MHILLSQDIWDFDLDAALSEISEQRREQAVKFKHELGQRLCVLAYQLLKQGLREAYGIEGNPQFEYNEHGKPAIVGHPEIFFNFSHCKEAVLCAISEQPVGVDVESVPSKFNAASFMVHNRIKATARSSSVSISRISSSFMV